MTSTECLGGESRALGEGKMSKNRGKGGAVAAIAAIGAFAAMTMAPVPAGAIVYCKAVGVPKGCVARPGGAAVVHPATGRVVYCTRPGYPRGCVVR